MWTQISSSPLSLDNPKQPFPPCPTLTSLPCRRRGCRRQFCHPWHRRNIPVPGALPSSQLGFPQLLIRNGFIPVIPQKTPSLTTWGCIRGSHWQGHRAKYLCRTAGFVSLSSMMKKRLQKPFSYPSVPGPHAGAGRRQVHLGVHPGGSTAAARDVSEEERGRREARETKVEKQPAPAGLAIAPACLVTDQQKPGEEVRGAALPLFLSL